MANEGLKRVKKAQSKQQKKLGKKKKKKEEAEKSELTEVEREIYTLQIADLTRKYERLKARVLELESGNDELQKNYEQLDEDRADVISYVKRELQKKAEEVEELKERVEGLLKSKDEESGKYREKILQLEHDYKVMHEQLTSEIKLLTGKLNSLEEFRLQRDDLLKKFKDQELRMKDQETSYKDAMYEMEHKFVIGKDKLKKEMEFRLLQLSQDFQATTQLRIAATTHRTIRENIALNNELNLMLVTSDRLREENEIVKVNDCKLRLGLELHVGEKKMVIAKNRVQKKIIETLTTEHEQMEEVLAELQHKANHGKTLENKLKSTVMDLNNALLHTAELEQKLDASNYEQTVLRLGTVEAERETKRLQKILRHTIRAVKNVLEIQSSPSQDDTFNMSLRESLLDNLLGLLNMADLPPEEPDTTVHAPEIYEIGDLGLISKVSSITTVGSGHYSKTSFKKSKTPSVRSESTVSSGTSTKSSASKSAGSTKSKEESETQLAEVHSASSVKSKGSKKGSLGSIKEQMESSNDQPEDEEPVQEEREPSKEDEED